MRIFKEVTQYFDWPNDPDKAKIKIKYLNEGETQDLIAKSRRLEFEVSDKGEQVARFVPDETILKNKRNCARIVAWENFFDDEGNKLECTDKNKIWVAQQDGATKILEDFYEKLDGIVKKEKDKEEKNSRTSQGGSAK